MLRCQLCVRGHKCPLTTCCFIFTTLLHFGQLPSCWMSTVSMSIFNPKHTSTSTIIRVKLNNAECQTWAYLNLCCLFLVLMSNKTYLKHASIPKNDIVQWRSAETQNWNGIVQFLYLLVYHIAGTPIPKGDQVKTSHYSFLTFHLLFASSFCHLLSVPVCWNVQLLNSEYIIPVWICD